mgnify:CR=1 FL=1
MRNIFKIKRRRKETRTRKKNKVKKNKKDEQDVQQNSKYELFNSLFTIYKKKKEYNNYTDLFF